MGRSEPARVMFVYWGRRGALTRFTYEVGCAVIDDPKVSATISVSRQNEDFETFREFNDALFPIDTFGSHAGAMAQAWRIPLLRKRLAARLKRDRTQAVIELMPHVWSPLVMPVVRQAGARHVMIVHDADAHPGDRTTVVKGWIDQAIENADLVLTLSGAVAGRLENMSLVPHTRLMTLFHPDLHYGPLLRPVPPANGDPIKLLFLGRIMRYKGLPLFIDAVNILRDDGVNVELGVFGEGNLGIYAERLEKMGAEVVNRWLSQDEIASILARYHAVVLSHTTASQSGVAATALGAGLPVIATPVGGLIEQIKDGETGIIAARADATALAEAIERLMLDPKFYGEICYGIVATREQRSMARFVEECVSHALYAGA